MTSAKDDQIVEFRSDCTVYFRFVDGWEPRIAFEVKNGLKSALTVSNSSIIEVAAVVIEL